MTHATRILLALSLAMLALPAAAHPLHGTGPGFAAGMAHPFLGLDHLLAMVAVGAWAAQVGGRAIWVVPLSFVVAMVMGGVLGIAGWNQSYVEPMIAASVFVLGLLVSASWKVATLSGSLLVGGFALFHGLAHAAELPGGGSAPAYAFGFALATAALHAAGIAIAVRLRARTRYAGVPIVMAGLWLLFLGGTGLQ